MNIDATFKADLDALKIRYYAESGIRLGTPTVSLVLDKDDTGKLFGAEVAEVAFGGMVEAAPGDEDGDAKVSWQVKKLTPNFIFETHVLHLAGHGPLGVQPEIKSIVPVKKQPKVAIKLDLPVALSNKDLSGELSMMVGEVVEVKLQCSQQQLPGMDGSGATIRKRPGQHGNLEPAAV